MRGKSFLMSVLVLVVCVATLNATCFRVCVDDPVLIGFEKCLLVVAEMQRRPALWCPGLGWNTGGYQTLPSMRGLRKKSWNFFRKIRDEIKRRVEELIKGV
jgi:hypothetical protein